MTPKTLTKEQAVSLLAEKLDCSPDALAFLLNTDNAEQKYNESLMIPEQRILN